MRTLTMLPWEKFDTIKLPLTLQRHLYGYWDFIFKFPFSMKSLNKNKTETVKHPMSIICNSILNTKPRYKAVGGAWKTPPNPSPAPPRLVEGGKNPCVRAFKLAAAEECNSIEVFNALLCEVRVIVLLNVRFLRWTERILCFEPLSRYKLLT